MKTTPRKIMLMLVLMTTASIFGSSLNLKNGKFSYISKGTNVEVKKNEIQAKSSEKILSFRLTLDTQKITSESKLSFEWKIDNNDIKYTAFSIYVKGEQAPYFIWFKNINAAKEFEKNKWHKINILLTDLKTLKGKKLTVGKELKYFSVSQNGVPPHSLKVRNITLSQENNSIDEQKATTDIRVWPRRDKVVLPTNLEQFIFIDFLNFSSEKKFNMQIELPPNIEIKGFPKSTGFATLPPNRIYPIKWSQKNNILDMQFSPIKSLENAPYFLILKANVTTKPGDYTMKIKLDSTKEFKVKVYDELSTLRPKNLMVKAWQYSGLSSDDIPTYITMMRKTGFNALCNMQGDPKKEYGISDEIKKQGMKLGLVYFSKKIQAMKKYYEKDFPNIKWNETYLLENPQVYKKLIKKYIEQASGNRKIDIFVYDAEAGALRYGKIQGDTSADSLKSFAKFANIKTDKELNNELIYNKYSKEWVDFRCYQTNQTSKIIREMLDENYPDVIYCVYSGYEYDFPPFKDRTRKFYSVDWKTMAETNVDFIGTGYGGDYKLIEHTSEALKGRSLLMPAEMYRVNFKTQAHMFTSVEKWTMRLINSFVASGMKGGISIWYGNVLDGSALISINEAVKFMSIVEPFILSGEKDNNFAKVSPQHEQKNIYTIRNGGNILMIVLNNDANTKNLRISLQDVNVKGYTGELQIIELVNNKEIPATNKLNIKMEPYSYKIFNILDDGN